MPEITLIIDQDVLDAINASYADMMRYEPRRLPVEVSELLRRKPESVMCLTRFANGKYRIGGDFFCDYVDKRSGGTHRELRASNVDADTGMDNTGENSFN